jgi:hypothetical protein
MCAEPKATIPVDLAERLQTILASKDLTLYQLSRRSESLYGRPSPYFLPHNLYYDLRSGTFRPSLYQLAALSRFSNYRFIDWVHALAFHVEDIARLQTFLPSKRTSLLNSTLEDPYCWIPWPENKVLLSPNPRIVPLSHLLQFTSYRRLGSLWNSESRDFLYVKIGREDTLAFPELLPGSIVRVNPNLGSDVILRSNGTTSDDLFLIEHCKGLCCCRLRVVGNRFIVPVSTQLSFAQVELRFPEEARCLGVVDFEIRPLAQVERPEVSNDLGRHWNPQPLRELATLSQLLRASRRKMNLSLRDVSALSRQATEVLANQQYFVSPSSLSDYETLDTAPRHFYKTVTLCAVYGLQLYSFLNAIGIEPASLGQEAMPDRFVGRISPQGEAAEMREMHPAGFLKELLGECGNIPFFLLRSPEALTGLANITLDDCFWVGSEPNPLHPYLAKALLVVVNRRKRKPVHFRSKPLWEQPLYMILKRDGTYLCACCGLENGHLLVHPYSKELYRPIRLRYHDEAEVVGQVVTIAKKI